MSNKSQKKSRAVFRNRNYRLLPTKLPLEEVKIQNV